jgi:leucyl-tRNA synthetase
MPEADEQQPAYRYTARLAGELAAKWQERWEKEGTFHTPNPVGDLSAGFERVQRRPSLYVLDMFPYPSGSGLHVGHPLGYIGTDVWARYKRMAGYNVLHTLGYDAFGLPAEQYAIDTGQHPRITTEANVATMRRQLRALGLAHDPRRSVSTTDLSFVRWTQWIFLLIFNSWFDEAEHRARPIAELVPRLQSGETPTPDGRPWDELSESERRQAVDFYRLAYIDEAPVNWCPALGTVLANEEVTADGRSDRGNYPVYRRPLKQWMLRITAYAERLLADLDRLDWPQAIKLMQRNWIGRSEGASARFPLAVGEGEIDVFTTRPDTLFGATYMVLAPEHPLVDQLAGCAPGAAGGAGSAWPAGVPETWTGGAATPADAVAAYRRQASTKSEIERQVESREKTGVYTGADAINPCTGEPIPVFIADYVLMGYGTGAIMAVPAHDQRDFEFAKKFGLPLREVVVPPDGWLAANGGLGGMVGTVDEWREAYAGDGLGVNSANDTVSLNELPTPEAKRTIIDWLESTGRGTGTINYKLRDWLFSRQRYWGEPFPIVYDETGLPIGLPESMLPVPLPEIEDYAPRVLADDDDSMPEPPLGRATDWATVSLDLGRGDGVRTYRRELNTMPQWAGSCWYYLRYLDPDNDDAFCDPDVERYWMTGAHREPDAPPKTGGVDLYVGGVEHAVLHLLYARFWHKVLYDRGYVSTPEPFQRLYNQGYILAYAYTDARGFYVPAEEVESRDGGWYYQGAPVARESGKMGKSLKNSVTPDDIIADYGTDTLRLYEMAMGPLDTSRPWNTADIIGVHRFLQRLWRNVIDINSGEARVADSQPDDETLRLLHRTVAAVSHDMEHLEFNTAVARLIEFNNHLTRVVSAGAAAPRQVAEAMALMLAPLAPHTAEEIWARLGHPTSLAYEPFPVADAAYLVDAEIEIPVQVNGKVRAHIRVPPDADAATIEAAARAHERVAAVLAEAGSVRRTIVVPGRLINFVLG